jgi:hypothetical protein
MANINESLAELMSVDGAIGCALVDYNSGMILGKSGGGTMNLDLAAAGNAEVVKAKMRIMKGLGITGGIEDFLITLEAQYHIIRPMESKPGLFIYYVLDKSKANLGMARFKASDVEKALVV